MANIQRDDVGEAPGQAQMKRDDLMEQGGSNQYQAAMDKLSNNSQNSGYDFKGQATNFFQQTGEQVKNMAQGAAEAVKNTLGMNSPSSPNTATNPPNNLSNPSNNPTSRA